MANRQKILEEIHPLTLIKEVQQRPALYSRHSAEAASVHHRLKIWADVAASLFPDWQLCSKRVQDERVSGLMKKWRNLRDTFKRQIEIQKKIREGANIKKKQYVYFKHMSFLLPHVGDDEETPPAPPRPSSSEDHGWQPASKRLRSEDSQIDYEEIDEDKHFLLSLVPSFKRMNEDEKLTAKMEILKVIKAVKESSASLELQYEQLVPARALAAALPVDVKLEALTADCDPDQ